jgi:hypothetical protein
MHHPVTSRTGEVITTAVTNMDIHDISRTCRTYEVDHYFLVTPIIEQKHLVDRILGFWQSGLNRDWHPDRAEALGRTRLVASFEAVKEELTRLYPGLTIEVAMPDARALPGQLSYEQTRIAWAHEERGVKVIVFGTGWGLTPEFHREVNRFLAPIYGPLGEQGYNHLSVRSAAAIILDRLFGIH